MKARAFELIIALVIVLTIGIWVGTQIPTNIPAPQAMHDNADVHKTVHAIENLRGQFTETIDPVSKRTLRAAILDIGSSVDRSKLPSETQTFLKDLE